MTNDVSYVLLYRRDFLKKITTRNMLWKSHTRYLLILREKNILHMYEKTRKKHWSEGAAVVSG